MICITEPIALRCNTDILLTGNGFEEKIRGNYSLMNSEISEEDLLHAVTQPADYLLLQENRYHSIRQENHISMEENKTEILNRLIQRIYMTANGDFTYQDKVYITTILQKLGITDASVFMKQVRQLKEEVDQTKELTNLYWNNLNTLTQVVEEYRQDRKETQDKEGETTVADSGRYLHQKIMDRLQTGAIYRILQNFMRYDGGDSQHISNAKLQMSEHYRTSQNILLNRLENTIRREEIPLEYIHHNFYEKEYEPAEVEGEKALQKTLAPAILLEMMDSLFQTVSVFHGKESRKQYDIDHSLYHLADRTLLRFQERSVERSEYNTGLEKLSVETYFLREKAESTEGFLAEFQEHEQGEQLREQLIRIEKNNVENRKRYLQALQEMKLQEAQKKKPSGDRKERMKKDSLRALEHPEEFLLEYRQEQSEKELEREAQNKRELELLPEDSRRIFAAVEEYLNTPEYQRQGGAVKQGELSLLHRDIESVHRDEIQNVRTEVEEQKIKTDLQTEKLVERIRDAQKETVVQKKKNTEEIKQVSMVHRQTQNTMDEERLRQLIVENAGQNGNKIEKEEVEIHHGKTIHHQEKVENRTFQRQEEDLETLIQRGVQRQMETISEKVLDRMERKLDRERKRRGF